MGELYGAHTLQEFSRRMDSNDKIAKVIEIINKKNEILDDIMWVEGNLITGHKTTIRTGIPTPAWRMLNYGVPQIKSTTMSITDTCGMLEAYSEVDKKLADLNGNKNDFMLSENKAIIEGFGQKLAETLFYGNNIVNPEAFTGLAYRYSQLSTDENKSGYNIVDFGGSTNLTSIWIAVWGDDTMHGIYPKGSKAGLSLENLGQKTKETINGSETVMHEVYRTHYSWDCGLTVRNWRAVARIANININALIADPTKTNLIPALNSAIEKIEEFITGGKVVIYMHPTLKTVLKNQMMNKGYAQLSYKELEGKMPLLSFDGIPIRSCRALSLAESKIV